MDFLYSYVLGLVRVMSGYSLHYGLHGQMSYYFKDGYEEATCAEICLSCAVFGYLQIWYVLCIASAYSIRFASGIRYKDAGRLVFFVTRYLE